MLTKIQKWGNSQGIRLPKKILKHANLKNGDTVEISAIENQITLTIAKKTDLQSIFENYEGNYQPKEYDWGKPQGREVW